MTKMRLFALAALLSFALGTTASVFAQDEESSPEEDATQAAQESMTTQPVLPEIVAPLGTVITPDSSVVHPEDAGLRAHTNHLIFVPAGHPLSSVTPAYTFAETPASLGCVYKVGPSYTGCN